MSVDGCTTCATFSASNRLRDSSQPPPTRHAFIKGVKSGLEAGHSVSRTIAPTLNRVFGYDALNQHETCTGRDHFSTKSTSSRKYKLARRAGVTKIDANVVGATV